MDNLFFLEAKCVNTGKAFYIRFDKAAGGKWCQTYGVKDKPISVSGSTNNTLQIDISKASVGPQYKCPFCGNTGYVRCGTCGKISCKPNNDKKFHCASCGVSGEITGTIKDIKGNSGTGQ